MLSNKKGIAMLIVFGIIFALLALTGAAIVVSLSHFKTSSYQLKRARAFYAAEAALQHALWKCREGNYDLILGDTEPTITVNGTTVRIDISPQDAAGFNTIYAIVDY